MRCKYCGSTMVLKSSDTYELSKDLSDYRIRETFQCSNESCKACRTVDKNDLGKVLSSFYYK